MTSSMMLHAASMPLFMEGAHAPVPFAPGLTATLTLTLALEPALEWSSEEELPSLEGPSAPNPAEGQ